LFELSQKKEVKRKSEREREKLEVCWLKFMRETLKNCYLKCVAAAAAGATVSTREREIDREMMSGAGRLQQITINRSFVLAKKKLR
jgi:hypothetical protein